jgi:hypothetical protein
MPVSLPPHQPSTCISTYCLFKLSLGYFTRSVAGLLLSTAICNTVNLEICWVYNEPDSVLGETPNIPWAGVSSFLGDRKTLETAENNFQVFIDGL